MRPFQYSPLDHHTRSVRLLQLCRGNGAFVECYLFDALLRDPEGVIPYEALSYTWGGTDKPYEIEVDRQPMAVTKNVYFALQHLRHADQDRILWIDAICIDQSNDKERGHQVGQMTSIYEQAERVMIWLGEGTGDTDLLFDHLTRVRQQAKVYDETDVRWVPSKERWFTMGRIGQPERDVADTALINQHARGLNYILRHPWFNRVWIIQEVAKARSAQVLCGTRSASAQEFVVLPDFLGITPEPHCQAILDIMPGSLRKRSWWSQNRDLYTLLFKFRKSQATDPRDAIFALLGISDTKSTSIPTPDYEKGLEEITQETIYCLLGFQKQECCVSSMPKWSIPEFLRNLENLRDGVFAWAAEHGEDTVVKLLLDPHRVYPGSQIQFYQKPLLAATKNGHEACVRLILNTKKAKIIWGNSEGAPLFCAAKYGHTKITELLLGTKKANINLIDSNGKTPLLVAAEQGFDEIVKLLLNEKTILVDLKGKGGQTPLSAAVRNMHESTAKLILDTKSVDVNAKDTYGRTPLLLATENGHTAMVELLLSQDTIQVHTTCDQGWAPIWRAAQSGYDDIVEILQEWEARSPQEFDHKAAALRQRILDEVLKARKPEGTLPASNKEDSLLMWAAMHGHNYLVQLLLETDMMEKADRHSLLAWALESKCDTVVVLLLKTGKIYLRPDGPNRAVPLLEWAIRDGHAEFLDLLLKSPAVDFDLPCANRNTLLYSAAKVGDLAIVKLLTDSGRVNCNSINGTYRQTPLSAAIETGFTDVVKYLLGTGKCDVDVKDSTGWTPLSMAVQRGRVSIVRMLLDEFLDEVDLHSRDFSGDTPIVLAEKRKCKIIYQMLIEADEKKKRLRPGLQNQMKGVQADDEALFAMDLVE